VAKYVSKSWWKNYSNLELGLEQNYLKADLLAPESSPTTGTVRTFTATGDDPVQPSGIILNIQTIPHLN